MYVCMYIYIFDTWTYTESAHVAQVTELAEHFGLDERVTRLLDEEMKKRRKTFEEDLQALGPLGSWRVPVVYVNT
jgi:hypothetical protein